MGYAAEYLNSSFSSFFSAIAVSNIIPFSGQSIPTSNQSIFSHAIKTKVRLPLRRQHPPANEQPTHKRIQTPPVRSHNVQKYSPVRGHLSYSLTTRLRRQQSIHHRILIREVTRISFDTIAPPSGNKSCHLPWVFKTVEKVAFPPHLNLLHPFILSPHSSLTQQFQPFPQSCAATCPTIRGLRKCCQCENVSNILIQRKQKALIIIH